MGAAAQDDSGDGGAVPPSPLAAVAEAKVRLRVVARARRAALGEDRRAAADAGIARRLRRLAEDLGIGPGGPRVLGAYAAMRAEVDLDPLLARWLREGVEVALPRITGPGAMAFHVVRRLPTAVRAAPPVREPSADLPLAVPDVVVVPGLAFDRHGSRLGHGGGFYDRWLAAHPGVTAVGVCREAEVVDAVPRAEHDVLVGYVVTEDRVYR